VGCLVRSLGGVLLLIALAIGARRLLEKPAQIPPPSVAQGERDFTLNGVRWRSRETDGKGVPIVFVHGLLSTSASWKRALPSASAGHPSVAVDLPGFGFSDRPWPFDYTVAGQAQALLAYLEARGFEKVALVGNSLGGGVCLVAAAAQPARVSALVLVGSASPVSRIPWNFQLLRAPGIGELEMEFLIRPVQEAALRYRLFAHPERVTGELVDDDWIPITVPGTRRAALAAIRSNTRGYENLLSRVQAPTLVLWGKEDRILPAEEGLRLSSEIRGSRLVILPDTGHIPQEETPQEFAGAVSQFLGETLPK